MSELDTIKTSIEQMVKVNQVEILKILLKHNVKINENKSGIFVNLSFLAPDILKDINTYLQYVNIQENSLQQHEAQKAEFKTAFFEPSA